MKKEKKKKEKKHKNHKLKTNLRRKPQKAFPFGYPMMATSCKALRLHYNATGGARAGDYNETTTAIITNVYEGPSMPVRLADPLAWRSLVCSYNLQGGHYPLPTAPTYPWDKWEHTYARSLSQMRRKFEQYGDYEQDESREFLYMVLENYMSRNNNNGRQCMLRAICENAQVHEHVGIFAKVLDVVLTPGKENLDNSYRMALQAGRHGADCIKLFNLCLKGSSLLDQYIDEL